MIPDTLEKMINHLMMTFAGGFNFTYGRLEANMSVPSEAGVVSTLALIPSAASSAGQVRTKRYLIYLC